MKRIVLAAAAIAAVAIGCTQNASADQPMGYPFYPFGFYQPYGAQYGASLGTPPYFALNPPVYYGARHARPYGLSPFAAPPMVSAPETYKGRLATDFYLPESEFETPAAAPCNPCVSHSAARVPVQLGEVRTNPFVTESKLAAN
ncbi:hypothetical protein FYK55_12460 [Roseiconus nitratireducens]|uniref:Lipoprotein n=1 Tax=Roseiconus nitratireducens TaxID=2605748 RepID=A0A5M6DD42_9BACT|nr:hypothetical protein [Roseiconus nitratireducens]KAA5543095.1 hypothetical protein FYK55_12460 [Roseiconus nitratireducens]